MPNDPNAQKTRSKRVPSFGPLRGVRVVYSGQNVAGPFAASLMAEYGADVLWLESPLVPDMTRSASPWTFQMERRNQRTLSLNIPTETGKRILLDLLADADVFIESSKGGQFEKWALTDEVLWGANPQLVIVHVSGYGQNGDRSYVERGSFDPIAQAFGCYLQHNGPPDGPPLPASPIPGDYFTGLFACSAALAAVIRSRASGEGESIDVAMFEVLMRVGGSAPMAYFNEGTVPVRKSTREAHGAGTGMMLCKDGGYVYIILRGAGVMKRGLPLVGLEVGTDLFPEGVPMFPIDSPAGQLLDQKITEFCAARSAEDVDAAFNARGVPCSRIFTYEAAENDPHYAARNVLTNWKGQDGQSLRGVKVVPDFLNNPAQIWRGGPNSSQDSAEVLQELGFSPTEIADLASQGVISVSEEDRRTLPNVT